MLLFFSPVFNLLSKTQKQAKLVYLGVELIPANDTNKSLQVAGDFHYALLSYIKFHIDAVIVEMEMETTIAVETQELTVTETETKPEPQNYTKAEIDEAYDSLFGFTPAPTPQVVEDTIKETAPEATTEQIFTELKSESLKDRMLACKCKQELEILKSEIGAEKASELWDSLTILERNHIKNVNLCKSPEKRVYGIGTRLQYTTKDGKKHNAKGIGHYLYGEALKDDERAILINGELKPTIVKRSQLKPFDDKAQKPLEPGELEMLQNFTQPQPKPEIEPDFEAPTVEEIAALDFSGLASPKPTGNSGSTPSSQASRQNVEAGDLIEVSDPESGLFGKIVEVSYLIANGKGAICSIFEGKSYCVSSGGYTLFQKNLLNSPKA